MGKDDFEAMKPYFRDAVRGGVLADPKGLLDEPFNAGSYEAIVNLFDKMEATMEFLGPITVTVHGVTVATTDEELARLPVHPTSLAIIGSLRHPTVPTAAEFTEAILARWPQLRERPFAWDRGELKAQYVNVDPDDIWYDIAVRYPYCAEQVEAPVYGIGSLECMARVMFTDGVMDPAKLGTLTHRVMGSCFRCGRPVTDRTAIGAKCGAQGCDGTLMAEKA
jgi:hypothetical protein